MHAGTATLVDLMKLIENAIGDWTTTTYKKNSKTHTRNSGINDHNIVKRSPVHREIAQIRRNSTEKEFTSNKCFPKDGLFTGGQRLAV